MITFLTLLALLGLVVFVVGAVMWFAARNDTTTTAGTLNQGLARPAERVRTAVTLMVGGLTGWAIITIIGGIIALVDAWT
jgi:hypothetical protein